MITEEKLKKLFPASQSNRADKHEGFDGKALHIREKRALASSLESLEKRLKVLDLEFRWDIVFLHNMPYNCLQPLKQLCVIALSKSRYTYIRKTSG